MTRRSWWLARAATAAVLGGILLVGCGDDGSSDATTTVPTTPRPIEEYRTQYLELLTANRCSDQETVAIQNDIAPDGTVGPGDFPVIQERLFPAWAARSDAISDFQDGLTSADWSDELSPIVDELVADLEESRASYRAASQLETFEAFAQFVFPATGLGEGKLREALDIPTDQDATIDWCAGVPDLGPTTTTTTTPTTAVPTDAGASTTLPGEAPAEVTSTTGTLEQP